MRREVTVFLLSKEQEGRAWGGIVRTGRFDCLNVDEK